MTEEDNKYLTEIKALQEQVASLKTQLETANKSISDLTTENTKLKTDLTTEQTNHKKVKQERDNLHQDILNRDANVPSKSVTDIIKERW